MRKGTLWGALAGIVAGIGRHKAVVILEPDALGLIPSSCNNGAG